MTIKEDAVALRVRLTKDVRTRDGASIKRVAKTESQLRKDVARAGMEKKKEKGQKCSERSVSGPTMSGGAFDYATIHTEFVFERIRDTKYTVRRVRFVNPDRCLITLNSIDPVDWDGASDIARNWLAESLAIDPTAVSFVSSARPLLMRQKNFAFRVDVDDARTRWWRHLAKAVAKTNVRKTIGKMDTRRVVDRLRRPGGAVMREHARQVGVYIPKP